MANNNTPLEGMMDVTLDKIRQMVDTNTIIGNPINTSAGTTILPVNKVSFGFASGGSDFASAKTNKDLFGGGSGAGVSLQPVGFLIIDANGHVRLIQLTESSDTVDRVINMLPDFVDTITSFVSKDKTKSKQKDMPDSELQDIVDEVNKQQEEKV